MLEVDQGLHGTVGACVMKDTRVKDTFWLNLPSPRQTRECTARSVRAVDEGRSGGGSGGEVVESVGEGCINLCAHTAPLSAQIAECTVSGVVCADSGVVCAQGFMRQAIQPPPPLFGSSSRQFIYFDTERS